jgi:hypothetical protein
MRFIFWKKKLILVHFWSKKHFFQKGPFETFLIFFLGTHISIWEYGKIER